MSYPTPESVLSYECVGYIRNGAPILRDVTWRVEPGQHWAVLGANGSGKTTMLRMATGYIWPSSGSIAVLGHPFGSVDLRELRKRVGWLSNALLDDIRPHFVVRDVVLSGRYASLGLYDRPSTEIVKQGQLCMRNIGCGHLAHRRFATLSQGEKQRVLVARAMMARFDLLVLDEPCVGLDIGARERLLDSIASLASSSVGPTVILVTHHVEDIPPSVSHVLILKGGSVLAAGPKEGVLTRATLIRAFDTALELRVHSGRYSVHPLPTERAQPLA